MRVAALEPEELDFPGARSIARVERRFERLTTGKCSEEITHYISSLVDPSAELAAQIIRAEWTIEGIHCAKDLTYLEDRQTIRKDNGPYNMCALRSFAVSLAHLLGYQCVPDAIPKLRKQVFSMLKYCKPQNRLTRI